MSLILPLAAVFLPLFPLSMLFNRLLAGVANPWLRGLLLLLWPQAGVAALAWHGGDVPDLLLAWAVVTALFYAYRAVALNDAGQWAGFVATSAWALLWLGDTADATLLHLQALAFSFPFVVLSLLSGEITRRFGAAHTGLGGGLAVATPRLAALFVVAVLATVATPVFPGFFAMLALVVGRVSSAALADGGLVVVWLLWSWSSARLLQGIVVGPRRHAAVEDLSLASTWGFGVVLLLLAVAGPMLAGGIL
jgi:NADH:ubiquinone oxidoreductase subunit 4 (subunit M)